MTNDKIQVKHKVLPTKILILSVVSRVESR